MTESPSTLQRPDDRELVRSSLRDMGTRALVDVVFGGMLNDTGLVITDSFGARTRSVLGQRVTPGEGLGGKAICDRRVAGVADYFDAGEITHRFDAVVRMEGLRSMAAVPVVVDDRPRAVLYAATRDRYHLGSGILSEFLVTAAAIAAELRVRDEVDRRIAILRVADGEQHRRDREMADAVREAYAELVSVSRLTGDAALAGRILAVAETLTPAPRRAGPGAPDGSGAVEGPALSRRQLDVLSQVALGCDYAEVARRLSLRIVTVRSYMRAIMAKLGCHNRVEAVAVARRLGLLP